MSVPAASNPWTKAEDSLATALPQLTAWQTLTGTTGDATAAAAFVLIDELRDPARGDVYTLDELRELKHYAIIYSASENGYLLVPQNALGDGWLASGTLVLEIHRLVTELEEHAEIDQATSEKATDRTLKNCGGDLIEQLIDYWVAHGGPRVQSVAVKEGPWHTHPDVREDFGHWQGLVILIEWGLGQK